MSWTLTVKASDGASTRATYSDASPGGIVGGFEWSTRGDGAPLQLRFTAVPSGVDIQPRDIIALEVDGSPAFWGVATVTWPSYETDVREYTALGGIELLRYRSHIDPASYPEQDVASIARQVISAYKHPAVTYDAALIPDLGDTISMPSVYRLELGQILDTLARTVSSKGVTWGVDAQGRAYFGVPSGNLEVDYAGHDVRWTQTDASDVVTRVDLLLATMHDPEPDGVRYSPLYVATPECLGYPKTPAPVVVSAVHADDAVYGRHRVYSAEGLIVQDGYPALLSSTNISNPTYATDGVVSTYASNAASGDAELVYSVAAGKYVRGVAVGFSLYNQDLHLEAEVQYSWQSDTKPPGGAPCAYSRTNHYSVQAADGASVRILALPPMDPKQISTDYDVTITLRVRGAAAADEWRVYDVQLIRIDMDRALEYAQSLLKPPIQLPASVRWPGHVTPVPQVTIIGAPGGDLSHAVTRWRYVWRSDAMETLAELGDAADDDLTAAVARVAEANQAAALGIARALTEVR